MPNLSLGIKFHLAEEGDADSMDGETPLDDIARLIDNVAKQVQISMEAACGREGEYHLGMITLLGLNPSLCYRCSHPPLW